MMGHDDLYREASSKAFVSEVYHQEELCAKLEATKLRSIIQSDHELSETLNSWKMDFDRLQYDGIAIMANHSRTLGMYKHDESKQEAVLVDWSQCRDDSWRRYNREAFEIRISNLARVLNRDLLPSGFRIMRCIGYIHATSTTIGHVFQPPQDAIPNKPPISLHHLLSKVGNPSDIPELGTRFALAKILATTIYEFHNIGWLHKNIQPDNILFWHRKAKNGALDLRSPYLVGFDLSRSSRPGEISEKPITLEGEDLYRHPSYKGAEATGFKPTYDYYSLGIVLFEIATWRLASRKSSKDVADLTDPDFIAKNVTNAAQDLGRHVGAQYRDAVLATLRMQFDMVWDSAEEADRDLALQKAFQKKVIDAIEFCQA